MQVSLGKINAVLERKGLVTHEITSASTSNEFVGLEFKGNRVSIKRRRLWRIKFAIDTVLRRKFLSGACLRILVGHITWALLIRREGFALLSSCYMFIEKHTDKQTRLWPSVLRELSQIESILPLLSAELDISWYRKIAAVDASNFGIGVCERELDVDRVGDIGRVSERWRFKVEDAIHARKHALEDSDFVIGDDIANSFNEIPLDVSVSE